MKERKCIVIYCRKIFAGETKGPGKKVRGGEYVKLGFKGTARKKGRPRLKRGHSTAILSKGKSEGGENKGGGRIGDDRGGGDKGKKRRGASMGLLISQK